MPLPLGVEQIIVSSEPSAAEYLVMFAEPSSCCKGVGV